MRLSKFNVMTEHSTESQQVTEHAKGRYVHILCLLVISFLAATCIHTTARMVLLEPNLADFAHYYFFSGLLSEGVDIYSLLPDELAQMKTRSTLPVYIAGKPEYSPAFFVAFIPLSRLPFLDSPFCMDFCQQFCTSGVCRIVGSIHSPYWGLPHGLMRLRQS